MEKRVLLVDDEASLRRSLTLGLMQRGYQTEPCQNGMHALKMLELFKRKGIPLDYVILDIKLPDIDGVKLLKVIKFKYPELPVIVISGYGNESIIDEVKHEKADAYLNKPFNIDELTKTFVDLPKAKVANKTAKAVDTIAKREVQTVSAYAMIKLDDKTDPMEVYKNLYNMENVLYCDATKGDYDIILLLQDANVEAINKLVKSKIMKTTGVKDITFIPVAQPVIEDNDNEILSSVDKILGNDKVDSEEINGGKLKRTASSYVLLDVEKEKINTIYPALHFNDNVVYCDYTQGKHDVILLLGGTSFQEIHKVINEHIKPLDGVLKIKECPIIKIFEV